MSIEFIGFENLPNTYIKEVAVYDHSETEMEIRTTVCIKDLPDGSIWFDTSELLAQFLKISVYYSTSREDSSEINSGNLDITTLQGIDSKSVKEPKKTEDNLIFEYSFSKIINNKIKEIATGLIYINENLADMAEQNNLEARPLNQIPYKELNPGSDNLKEIQKL